tara:strand:- start:2551 stop:3714 length:1164 start_codon:yes stop_codon:yes gene_type:complete
VPYYPFGQDDVIRNTIKTFPKTSFYVYDEKVYYNAHPSSSGSISEGQPINHVPVGNLSLYEYNVDRPSDGLIHPFLVKNGTLISFKTVTDSDFNDMDYGETIVGSYNMSASITRNYYNGTSRDKIEALKNTTNYYKTNSPHYAYTSDLGDGWNKGEQDVNLISIPSIFYGSQIKKGSLELNFYVSGVLIGTLKDERQNGELIQTGPEGSPGSGSVAGVSLYNEGFLILTGSWDLSGGTHTEKYNGTTLLSPSWRYFGVGAQDGVTIPSQKSAWSLDFRGTTRTQVVTMFANAPKGMINHSNNPTYITYGQASQTTGSSYYIEDPSAEIKNIVSSSYGDEPPMFSKETYISKIGIYDEHRNLIAIAKLATPVKKTEQRDLTFKLKLDI